LEDIGLMRMLPGMAVVVPCDYNQTKAAVKAVAAYEGPVYLRFGRPKVPNFTSPDQPFEIGKALVYQEGSDLTLIATGHLVYEALQAADQLIEKGIKAEVINMTTIKPLDKETILASVGKTKCVVTAEEHQLFGGLGEAIAGLLAQNIPYPIEMVAVKDQFGQSGTPEQLMKHYQLDAAAIVNAAEKALSRK
jgi:transketolase